MGTSTSYSGPKGKAALLPPWADSEPPMPIPAGGTSPETQAEGEAPTSPPIPAPALVMSWQGPKSTLTRYAGGGSSSSVSSTFRSYVRQHSSGSRGAARAAVTGRRSTARVMGFFADAARNGFAEAARRIGLRDFIGRDADSVLAALVDLLAPDGALLDEAAARQSVIAILVEIFDSLDVETNGVDALSALTENDLEDVFKIALCNTIEARFTCELTDCVERAAVDETEANRNLGEIHDYIRTIVDLDLEGQNLLDIDWAGERGREYIESWLAAAYAVLGDERP